MKTSDQNSSFYSPAASAAIYNFNETVSTYAPNASSILSARFQASRYISSAGADVLEISATAQASCYAALNDSGSPYAAGDIRIVISLDKEAQLSWEGTVNETISYEDSYLSRGTSIVSISTLAGEAVSANNLTRQALLPPGQYVLSFKVQVTASGSYGYNSKYVSAYFGRVWFEEAPLNPPPTHTPTPTPTPPPADWQYSISGNEAHVAAYLGGSSYIEVPRVLGGCPVTVFGQGGRVFPSTGTAVSTIVLPDSVTRIGSNAFMYSSARTIFLPPSLKEIGSYAFYGTRQVDSIAIPDSVTHIGSSAFADSSIQSIRIPDGVVAVPERAFELCRSLVELTIGEGVQEIGAYAFEGCDKLQRVNLPSSLLTIGDLAFYGCEALAQIHLSENIARIGYRAFANCLNLRSIRLPKSLFYLGNGAFAGCINLKSAILAERLTANVSSGPNVGPGQSWFRWDSFYNCPQLTTILCLGKQPDPIASGAVPNNVVIYYIPGTNAWPNYLTYIRPFHVTAAVPSMEFSNRFKISWAASGGIPMNVERSSSLNSVWTTVESNNTTGIFVDTQPPQGKAFYRVYLP